jgi:hypothetical protein
MCEKIDECDDDSDEDENRWNLKIEMRMVGGMKKSEGSVEVR